VVTEAPLLASHSVIEFIFHLAGNPDLGPSSGMSTCCEMGHVVTLNGAEHAIECDKERITSALELMFDAKLKLLQDSCDGLWLALGACAPTLLASTPQGRGKVRSAIAPRLASIGRDHDDVTPLRLAVVLQDIAEAKKLITAQSPKAPKLLMSSCCVGNLEMAELLLAEAVVSADDLDSFRSAGTVPLHAAAAYGHAALVRWLLLQRASVDSQKLAANPSAGETPLHCAALRGHAACCDLLLQHRADVGSCDCNGATPLHAAVTQPVHVAGSREPDATAQVLRLLLAARAEPAARDSTGRTPLQLSVAWGLRLLPEATDQTV